MKTKCLAILLTSVLALASCGGGGSETAGSETNGANEGGEREKIVRITASFPLQSDPAVGSNAVEAAVMFNVYDSLVFPDIDGTIVPHLAETWDVSSDGMKYTFHLREGVKFHDGSEVTAEDVAFSMNRLLAIGEGFSYLFVPYVEEAVAVDDTTVEFNMKQTFGPFVSALVRLSILNKDLVMENLKDGPYGEFGDYGKAFLLTADAGCGPYTITDVSVSEQMTAEKFDDYYLGWGENNPEKIQFIAVNDAATIRTLMSNQELEITDEWQSMENLNTLNAMEGIDVTNMYTGCVVNLEMNTKIAPTDDIHFRKAMAYLMDYATVTSSIYPGAKQAKGPVSSAYLGSNEDLFQYSYNLDKAKEELQQSPYYDQLANYPITIEWSADVPDEEKICLLLQQRWLPMWLPRKPLRISPSCIPATATMRPVPFWRCGIIPPHREPLPNMNGFWMTRLTRPLRMPFKRWTRKSGLPNMKKFRRIWWSFVRPSGSANGRKCGLTNPDIYIGRRQNRGKTAVSMRRSWDVACTAAPWNSSISR